MAGSRARTDTPSFPTHTTDCKTSSGCANGLAGGSDTTSSTFSTPSSPDTSAATIPPTLSPGPVIPSSGLLNPTTTSSASNGPSGVGTTPSTATTTSNDNSSASSAPTAMNSTETSSRPSNQNCTSSSFPPEQSSESRNSTTNGSTHPSTTLLGSASILSPQTPASGPSNNITYVPALTSSSKHSNHIGATVGGIIGGLAFLLLATVATILLYRRMRARRTAPSAEFMDLARGTTPGPGPVRMEGTTTPSGDRLLPLARQGSLEDDDDRPPAFTPGVYADPVLEKVQAAAEMREQYQRRDSYAAARADYKEGLGESEVGREDDSTKVGGEEGYGLGEDEKAGYAWAM